MRIENNDKSVTENFLLQGTKLPKAKTDFTYAILAFTTWMYQNKSCAQTEKGFPEIIRNFIT